MVSLVNNRAVFLFKIFYRGQHSPSKTSEKEYTHVLCWTSAELTWTYVCMVPPQWSIWLFSCLKFSVNWGDSWTGSHKLGVVSQQAGNRRILFDSTQVGQQLWKDCLSQLSSCQSGGQAPRQRKLFKSHFETFVGKRGSYLTVLLSWLAKPLSNANCLNFTSGGKETHSLTFISFDKFMVMFELINLNMWQKCML